MMKLFLFITFLIYLTVGVPCTPSQDNKWGQSQGLLSADSLGLVSCPRKNCRVNCSKQCGELRRPIYFSIDDFKLFVEDNVSKDAWRSMSDVHFEHCGIHKKALKKLLRKNEEKTQDRPKKRIPFGKLSTSLYNFVMGELQNICNEKLNHVVPIWKEYALKKNPDLKVELIDRYTDNYAEGVLEKAQDILRRIDNQCDCDYIFKKSKLDADDTKKIMKKLNKNCRCSK